eukprot:764022-Hanusia_phi.AAC.8
MSMLRCCASSTTCNSRQARTNPGRSHRCRRSLAPAADDAEDRRVEGRRYSPGHAQELLDLRSKGRGAEDADSD